MQRELVSRLVDFGSDPKARDASRVLRLVSTCNTKQPDPELRKVRVLWVEEADGEPLLHDFERLAEAVLPFTRKEATAIKVDKPAGRVIQFKRGGESAMQARRFSFETLHWDRVTDNLGVVTGKPVHVGGSLGREVAAARGGLFTTLRTLSRGILPGSTDLQGLSVVIQGFGNAGGNATTLFHEAGARIVAVGDSRGGVYCTDGIDPAAAHRQKRESGSLQGLAGCRDVTNEELLTLPCDILIPAALENQLRSDNTGDVQARMIVELANGPTTPDADSVFREREIPVLPDILANAGGATISYYEWVQNNENEQWDEDEVNGKLKRIMTTATDDIIEKQTEINGSLVELETERGRRGCGDDPLDRVDLRTAAFVVAVERVARVALDAHAPCFGEVPLLGYRCSKSDSVAAYPK